MNEKFRSTLPDQLINRTMPVKIQTKSSQKSEKKRIKQTKKNVNIAKT